MNGFPKLCCYSWNSGAGKPYVKPDGSLDMAAITALARYSHVTLDIGGMFRVNGPTRADVFLALRKLNPSIRIYWYLLLGWTYMRPDYGFLPDWTRETWLQTLKETNAIKADGFIRWDIPEVEKRLTADILAVERTGLADGWFFDYQWATSESGRKAMHRLIHALRQAGARTIIGNANDADSPNNDGCMREGFPSDLPISTEVMVRQWREGRPEKKWDWLQAGTGHTDPTSPNTQRAARYAHGYACLFDMLCSFGFDRNQSVPYHTWWFDFYDAGGKGTGWLGEPAGPPARVGGVWWRMFGGGMVVVNDGSAPVTSVLPKGLCRFDGTEMGSVTINPKDAVFLVRAR